MARLMEQGGLYWPEYPPDVTLAAMNWCTEAGVEYSEEIAAAFASGALALDDDPLAAQVAGYAAAIRGQDTEAAARKFADRYRNPEAMVAAFLRGVEDAIEGQKRRKII